MRNHTKIDTNDKILINVNTISIITLVFTLIFFYLITYSTKLLEKERIIFSHKRIIKTDTYKSLEKNQKDTIWIFYYKDDFIKK